MDTLQRQLDELQALSAMFPGEVVMDDEQQARLQQAAALLSDQGQIPGAWNGQHRELRHACMVLTAQLQSAALTSGT